METANLWKGDDLACFGGLDRPWHGTVLIQRKVSARLVIVVPENRIWVSYSPDGS
jgi:hypothetical protein